MEFQISKAAERFHRENISRGRVEGKNDITRGKNFENIPRSKKIDSKRYE